VCGKRDERDVGRHDKVLGLSVEARAIDKNNGVVIRQNGLRKNGEKRIQG
jgi:hypothetical protein